MVGGRDHRLVALVEVEIAAARKVGEWIAGAWAARRERHHRQQVERVGIEHRQARPFEPDADRHDPALAVERQRPALRALEGGAGFHAVAERPRPEVRVGHVGVVVQVAPPVRSHERVLGHRWRGYAAGLRGRADECRHRGEVRRILGNRRRRHAFCPGAPRKQERREQRTRSEQAPPRPVAPRPPRSARSEPHSLELGHYPDRGVLKHDFALAPGLAPRAVASRDSCPPRARGPSSRRSATQDGVRTPLPSCRRMRAC